MFSYITRSFKLLALVVCKAVISNHFTLGYFIVGASMNQFLTDTLKLTVGRLRPHFMDVCQPNITCMADNFHVYHDDIPCTRTSFPGKTDDQFNTMTKDMRFVGLWLHKCSHSKQKSCLKKSFALNLNWISEAKDIHFTLWFKTSSIFTENFLEFLF